MVVFSLAGWCRLIQTGFLRSRLTQDSDRYAAGFLLRGFHPLRPTFPGSSDSLRISFLQSFYPARAATPTVWAPPLSLATTRGITFVLFSYGYLDVSVPRVRLPASPAGMYGPQPYGLPHSDTSGSQVICTSPELFAACRVLLRRQEPGHPPCALLSFLSSPKPLGYGDLGRLSPSGLFLFHLVNELYRQAPSFN